MKSLKAFFLFVVLLSVFSGVVAQTPEWAWANKAGNNFADGALAIASDSSGNTYMTGYFTGYNVSFGGTLLSTPDNYPDIFVAKLDNAGNWLWAKRAGGPSLQQAECIAVDGDGNVYISGLFGVSATFGDITLSDIGSTNIFVAKLDSAGNWLWAKGAGSQANWNYGLGIALDAAANVYVTGCFQATVAFGATSLTCAGDIDIFVTKLDSSGNWLWAKSAGGTSSDFGRDIAVDIAGNVYLTGTIRDEVFFGSTSLGNSTANAQENIFVAKLDSAGNWLWAKDAGGLAYDYGCGIALDSAANIYVTGYFWLDATFGSTTLNSIGDKDIFVAKLDSGGNWHWAKRAGGTHYSDGGNDIAVDSAGDVYLSGFFSDTDADFGETILTSNGYLDIFVAKLGSAGNWLWAKGVGGIGEDQGYGIALDSNSNIYMSGHFAGTNVAFGDITLISNGHTGQYGQSDIFVAKLGSGVSVSDDLNPPVALNTLSASPNPFKQGTTLSIALDKQGGSQRDLRVVLYDLRGRRIKTLDSIPAGGDRFTLSWDGRDAKGATCPSGIYLAKLYAGQKQLSSTKLTLIR
ncbi:MAG: SBBP repeat-containing protein [Candidatus Cloacimonetes bacterium]|nr:SBBP repeat-containing protein [Candidatus Cloacimonadota bacterium]